MAAIQRNLPSVRPERKKRRSSTICRTPSTHALSKLMFLVDGQSVGAFGRSSTFPLALSTSPPGKRCVRGLFWRHGGSVRDEDGFTVP